LLAPALSKKDRLDSSCRIRFKLLKENILATTKNKRWNGNVDTLPADFLKGVLEKMGEYGDRVQFSLASGGPAPSYQLVNQGGKAMAFDRNHHLLRPEGDEFAGSNASPVYTLDQIKAAVAGARIGSRSAPGTKRAAGTGTRASAARLAEQHATERYAYFKENRQALPPSITEHSDEIAELMKAGKPAEEAFREVVQKYY
jgi:hypothetical protein